jgi:hypothetical protein
MEPLGSTTQNFTITGCTLDHREVRKMRRRKGFGQSRWGDSNPQPPLYESISPVHPSSRQRAENDQKPHDF